MDTTGHPTICYGFNLDRTDARSKIASVGGDYDKVRNGGCLSHSQCEKLLDGDIKVAQENEERVFGDSTCSCVKAVLVDMTYNLGEAGINAFGTFKSFIKDKNYKAAGEDLKGTKWCQQVKIRCTDDVTQIERGCGGEIEISLNITELN